MFWCEYICNIIYTYNILFYIISYKITTALMICTSNKPRYYVCGYIITMLLINYWTSNIHYELFYELSQILMVTSLSVWCPAESYRYICRLTKLSGRISVLQWEVLLASATPIAHRELSESHVFQNLKPRFKCRSIRFINWTEETRMSALR